MAVKALSVPVNTRAGKCNPRLAEELVVVSGMFFYYVFFGSKFRWYNNHAADGGGPAEGAAPCAFALGVLSCVSRSASQTIRATVFLHNVVSSKS